MACGISRDLRQPTVTVADVLLSRGQVKVGSFKCLEVAGAGDRTNDNIPRYLPT